MPVATATKPATSDIHGISYDDVKPGKPPILITTAPRPSSARANLHPSLRPRLSPRSSLDGAVGTSKLMEEIKRDSGYTLGTSGPEPGVAAAADVDSAVNNAVPQSPRSSKSIPKSPSLSKANGGSKQSPKRLRKSSGGPPPSIETKQEPPPQLPDLSISSKAPGVPTISFEDLTSPGKMEFSKRGSLLIGGVRPSEMGSKSTGQLSSNGRSRKTVFSTISAASKVSSKTLSSDEEALSQRIRSMYDVGTDDESFVSERLSMATQEPIEEEAIEDEPSASNFLSPQHIPQRRVSSGTTRRVSFLREDQELAGGIEDWQDVNNDDVDRYGFIVRRSPASVSCTSLPATAEPGLHRVATSLQIASETPRRSFSKLGRVPSTSRSTRSVSGTKEQTTPPRPVSSQSAYSTTKSISRARSVANRLPHNRNRRFMDEAGDMLTLPPGLAELAEQAEGGRAAIALKKKEWSREEKWRKMAKVIKPKGVGGPTEYEFDTKHPKLISRTWKGIPDRWRATAWHSFLSASAKKHPNSVSDAELIACFEELVDQSSPDDVQIDIDVPRTISGHIMFRRRYRGGQRLLFRVLHALSLYFPDTGYVQGMATLAATFLCYFEEQMAFVMLVRMWQLRGLDRLYKQGFAGLMQALDEFEQQWLAGGTIDAKLVGHSKMVTLVTFTNSAQKELCIPPTAYGTRWYLTIFNYSIPFPAQLRVWDVFLLLGDPDVTSASKIDPAKANDDSSFHGQLDVLHATSAALIDGMREILVDSDFENAMKTLTSWVPIKDEELLMRVAQAEWKVHRRKK
jgi:hypothetical protein